ncbi:MAG: type II toxin-antitoxin system RelE/ParE family toxin [Burkholderiales bacterium]
MADKPLLWLHGEVKSPPFSPAARIEAGVLLRRLQRGERLSLPHSRPMPDVGKGCHELRIVDEGRAWRIMYAVRSDAIVILEVFSKTSRTTPAQVLHSSRRRLSAYESVVQGKESKR